MFFVYAPHGGVVTTNDNMEYAPNAETVRRQLAERVRTGKGRLCLVSDMAEVSWAGRQETVREDEWPTATDAAYMAVWRCRTNRVPTGGPSEVWKYSGNMDRPHIVPVDTGK